MGDMRPEHIYLDYNATAPCRGEVIEEMVRVLKSECGNPSSTHQAGRNARRLVEESRERIAAALGADPEEVIFTGGGTEADNLAVFGTVDGNGGACPHVVTSEIEHPAVLTACRAAESRGMARVTYVACDESGLIEPDSVSAELRADTSLVSIMHANNEVGTIQPIRRIAKIAHSRGVPLHCDAVQSLGRIPVNVDDLGVDLLSFTAHKLGGPKGVGALYARSGIHLEPMLTGGPQERQRRAGTENVPAIVGFAKAVELAVGAQASEARRLGELKEALWEMLGSVDGIHLNGEMDVSLANTLNVSFEGLSGEDLMGALDSEGIEVSTGSACAAGAGKSSHVIAAMGGGLSRGCGPVRVSMGYRTTEAEVVRCGEQIRQTVARLRNAGKLCSCVR